MDKSYIPNKKLIREVERYHKSHTKKYRAWRIVQAFLFIVALAFVVLAFIAGYKADPSSPMVALLFTMFAIAISFITLTVTYGLINRLGADERFGLRLMECVTLYDNKLVNSWVPKLRYSLETARVAYSISYNDVTRIDYNEDHKRLEIYGRRIREEEPLAFLSPTESIRTAVEDDDKPYKIYAYFNEMDNLIEELQKRTGVKVNKTIGGDK